MELYIAGGCNEHGRNCFLVENKADAIAIDCGLLVGTVLETPQLSITQIRKIQILFITHSHTDHVGALPWLYENGFSGKIVLTQETYEQMKFKPKNTFFLKRTDLNKRINISDHVSFEWGRSGHCRGSVWYEIYIDNKAMLFSGDYCENSEAYQCDLIRNRTADIAVLDCAYGNDNRESEKAGEQFAFFLSGLLKIGNSIVLPCPIYGRAMDFLEILIRITRAEIYVENKMYEQYLNKESFWNKSWIQKSNQVKMFEGTIADKQAVYLISDPQMKKEKTKVLISKLIQKNVKCVFTGHVYHGTEAEKLLNKEIASFYRYYVHQNMRDVDNLINRNIFKYSIVNHCEEKIESPSVMQLDVGDQFTF